MPRPVSGSRLRVIGGILLVIAIVAPSPMRRAFGWIQRPFAAAGTWVAARGFGVFEPGSVSVERVTVLEAERAAMAVESAAAQTLRQENEELRRRLAFKARSGLRLVSADVIGRVVGAQSSAFVINRGSDDGVAVGMPVMVGEGILAGKVTSVDGTSATVAALTDRATATAAGLLNGARTIGVTSALDGSLLNLAYIPKDERVAVNDLVVTSGLEDNVPSGLVIGIVNAVESKETEPFQRAVVEPLVDVRRITSVSVILGKGL